MAGEATIGSSLQIVLGYQNYVSRPSGFTADVSAVGGPTPGQITVDPAGTDIDLSELTTPGLAWFQNLDETNYVEYGVWDPEMLRFYALGRILPGENYTLRLSPSLQEEYGTGPGTGTVGPGTNRLRFRAYNQPCKVRVDIFEN